MRRAILLMLMLFQLAVFATEYQPPQLWPRPQHLNMTKDDRFYLSPGFEFTSNYPSSDILQQAFTRYKQFIFPTQPSFGPFGNLSEITGLKVEIYNQSCNFIQFEVDESYTLSTSSPVSTITANTIFGAMHGLETFSQLVRKQMLPLTDIVDAPRFPWRGLLIDTSRNYQTLADLKTAIVGLSYDKMNVFHWHISDGQSFPFASELFPDLIKGAYSPQEVYTIAEVKELIEFANGYGIRVVPEFDMPSHAGPSWGVGYPFLTMNCSSIKCQSRYLKYTDPCNNFPFDATSDRVYDFLNQFIGEVTSVFKDDFLHMGGDEVVLSCWNTTDVKLWMAEHKMANFSQLEQYFLTNVQQYATSRSKRIVNWQEVFEGNFTTVPGTIIEVWWGYGVMHDAVKAGYQTLLAFNWYLNNLALTWEDFYENEPTKGVFNDTLKKNVLGGECCIWGENLDSTCIQPKIWPRTSAAAERLWSPEYVNLFELAQTRLEYHRCRFINRGINASPLNPGPSCYSYYL